ncbi:MAG TPA: retropepsin-like aspartic protease [Pyrinomonadaceae bacterium]|nr:retropepsin-like aspartic protease [Pyrinomonadaceae bacterium]
MKWQRKSAFWLACIFISLVAPVAQAQSAAEALARVRTAVGYERLRSHSRGVVAEGTARFRGMDSKYTFTFTPDGRFRAEIAGPLGDVTGFNGTVGWEVDWSGMPRVLELEDIEVAQFEAWINSGRWLDENGPFAISLDAAKTDDKQVALKLALKKGQLEATVFVDRATWLPKKAARMGAGGEEILELSDYRKALGFSFPHRVTRTVGGTTNVFEIRSVAEASRAARSSFEPVTARPPDTRWNQTVPPGVEARRVRSGHLLIHPLINGKDVGWFILDSGAGAMVIDTKVADRLSMPALGEILAVGVAGTTKARFRQGATFELGPLTIKDTRYLELDLGFLDKAFGIPIGGICGRDFFARAAVEIEIANEKVAIHDPSRYRLEGAEWQELFFSSRNPAVRARFENTEGLFKLDTGSDQTVSMHAPAVERLKLLSGRETKESSAGGVGGARAFRKGKLAWFELGGYRFEAPEAEFAAPGSGAFSDIYTVGNIGAGFLKAFRIVFDYGNKRVALMPLKAAKAAGAGAR